MPEPIDIEITESRPGLRLDRYLAERFPETSRGCFQRLISEGAVQVNGKVPKATDHPRAGDRIQVRWPEAVPSEVTPEDIPLTILHEDDDLLVVDKPAERVVHPAATIVALTGATSAQASDGPSMMPTRPQARFLMECRRRRDE